MWVQSSKQSNIRVKLSLHLILTLYLLWRRFKCVMWKSTQCNCVKIRIATNVMKEQRRKNKKNTWHWWDDDDIEICLLIVITIPLMNRWHRWHWLTSRYVNCFTRERERTSKCIYFSHFFFHLYARYFTHLAHKDIWSHLQVVYINCIYQVHT